MTIFDVITNRKRAEELEESESRYRQLVELSPDTIFIQAEGKIVFINPAGVKLFGAIRPEELLGLPVLDLIHPEFREMVAERIEHLRDEKQVPPIEEQFLRLDGSVVNVEVAAASLVYQGKPGAQVIVRDITERKRAEEEVKRLASYPQMNPSPVMEIDLFGGITFYNQAALMAVENLGPDAVLGDLIPEDLAGIIATIKETQEKSFYRELSIKNRVFSQHIYFAEPFKVLRIFTMDITARKQAEALLQESEKHYRSLFENMLNGYAYCQMAFEDGRPVDFTYLDVNHAFEALTGLKNVKGKKISEVIPGLRESDPQLFETYGRVALTGIPERFETYVEALEMWFSVSVYSPAKEHFVALFDVITERKWAEEALRESEDKYRGLIETTNTGYVIVNVIGQVLDANGEYVRLTGHRNLEEILGKNVIEWTVEQDREKNTAALSRCLQAGLVKNLELDYVGNDGQPIPVEINATAISTSKGVKFLSLVRDISERRQAEEALRKNEQFLRDIFNNIQDGLTVLDSDFNIIRVNRAIENLPFTQPMVGRKCYEVFHGRSEPCEVCPAQQVFLTGLAAEKIFTDTAADGSLVFMEIHAFPLMDYATGQVQRVIEYVRNITKRMQAEEALRKAEERYRSIFENAVEGIFQSTPEGRYIGANPAMARMFGYESPEELMAGITDIKTQVYVDQQRRAEFARLMARDSFVKNFEYQIHRKDGGELWISDNARAIRNDQGEILAFEGFMQDISERKEAEKELSRLRRHQELILNSTWEGILGLDLKGGITFVNPAAARLVGYEAGELLGRNSHAIWHHSKRDSSTYPVEECPIHMALQNGKAHHGTDEAFWRQDGTSFTVEYALAPILEFGEVIGEVLTFRDLSQQKEDQALTRSLIEGSPVGIYLLQGGKFVLTNHSFHTITGYAENELATLDFWKLVHPEDREAVRTNALKMLRGERFTAYEYRNIANGGEIKWIMETVIPIQYQGKRATLGYFMDITERKQLEAQFLQAQKMEAVGQLAGGVAHDFNNILATIMGYAEMMQLDLSPENPLHHKAAAIKKASERAASLTRQLLAFSRKQVQQTQVLNLNSVIGEMDKMLRRLITEDIDLSLNLEPRLAAVKADHVQMEQILMNLVVNARDAMPSGGRLTIETTNIDLDKTYVRKHPYVLPGPYVMMAVSDNGAGMDAETQSHIFEPFFTTKELGKGTGLGLSTVYGIVKQSQGSIEVYSEPGIGTTFKVYLPQVEADVSKAREGAQTDARLQGTETILVVEDEQGLRELICASLQRNGYTVLEAGNGHEALSTCDRQQGPIHLMLTDVVMPKLNGREIVERVAPMRPEMKVLFMSGYTEDVIIHHGVLDESMHFLEKPFMANVLLRKVRELLDNPVEN